MKKRLLVYLLLFAGFGIGVLLILQHGRNLPSPDPGRTSMPVRVSPGPVPHAPHPATFWSGLADNLNDPVSRLFLQLVVIILGTRAMAALFVRLRQPAVIGEMFAGLLLGPSLLGLLAPGAYEFIFPVTSLGTLTLLSQVGVCLFMFTVGMELPLSHLRSKVHTAALVSQVGILFPFLLGVTLSLWLYPRLSGPVASFMAFALFLGISMSITAFPVLARILQERGLQPTPLGATAIACAAVGDGASWALLAFVVAIVRATELATVAVSLGLVIGFVVLMLWGLRPRLPAWLATHPLRGGVPSKGLLAAVLILTFTAALTTEVIGIHALFGAFIAGVIMPEEGGLREYLKIRIENFSSVFLLPIFFAFTGLRTQVALINDPQALGFCLLIVLVASLGKLGGCMVAARLTGMNWHDSFCLGTLMNTRGLMELIAINIGYDLGILSPRIFAMLVLMALVTTFLTGPLLSLAALVQKRPVAVPLKVS